MKKRLNIVLLLTLVASTSFFMKHHDAHAIQSLSSSGTTPALPNYLMLRPAGTPIGYPIYVYQSTPAQPTPTQIAYMTGPSQQVFLGQYDATTNATYTLYYQQSGNWYVCSFSVVGMAQPTNVQGCTGVGIGAPATGQGIVNGQMVSVTSNAYPLGIGAYAWSPGPAPENPQATNYTVSRTITFENKTNYDAIQIGMACTVSKNPSNPACQNTNALFTTGTIGIPKGLAAVYTIPSGGIISSAFYVSAYLDNGAWKKTGGYYAGEQPYATKFEPTWLPAGTPDPTTQVASVEPSNIDVSAVDGFNFGATLYPTQPTYCTFTIGEGSNVLGVDYYGPSTPLAKLTTTASLSLFQLCQNSTTNGWNLVKLTSSGDFAGCYNPCRYAKINEATVGKDTMDKYCCRGQYGTQAIDCYGPGLASSSNFVSQLSQYAQHVYTFAYSDSEGDYACPGMTNFVIKIH